MTASILGVIPCRYSSSRLPGKPLLDICGKSMIERVYGRASLSSLISRVIVATDDARIMDAVSAFGGEAVMTSPGHQDGTSRAAEAALLYPSDYVINIQGDEPMIDPLALDELCAALAGDPEVDSATLCTPLADSKRIDDPNVVKVVRKLNMDALYFSRSPVPFVRNAAEHEIYEHVGIYGFRSDFLQLFAKMEQTPLAYAESLEQLKVLEHGCRMRVIVTMYPPKGPNVNTREDLDEVRRIVSVQEG